MAKTVMCKNCNNYRNDWCEIVSDSPDPDMVRDCRHFWLKTNADRIRAMTDEELADWHASCPYIDKECTMKGCVKCVLEWLQQPAEGGMNNA